MGKKMIFFTISFLFVIIKNSIEKKVFVLSGQSNMVGIGCDPSVLPENLRHPQGDI
jgi:hypothetical protein